MLAGLVLVIVTILLMVGVPKGSIVLEKKGLRSIAFAYYRPGDIVALDFFGLGASIRHLVIDAVISTVYRNTILPETSTIPGYVAKLAEDKKFKADEKSPEPVVSSKHGDDHALFPLPWRTVALPCWELIMLWRF